MPLKPQQPSSNSQQQGFALLTVLLIVALVATLSAQLVYQQHLSISRSANMLHQSQSLAVAWGLEGWVKEGLKLDGNNSSTDHLQEAWAQPLIQIPFEGGEISGRLYDLQGRLNLNNVIENDTETQKLWQLMINRWAMQVVGVQEPLAETLTDWVDADEDRLPGGAESDAYLLMKPPYRTANQPMVMLEELKRLQDWPVLSFEQWHRLKKTAAVLPEVTAINVNTAPEEVLLVVSQWMNESVVKAWLDLRKQSPAKSVSEFKDFISMQTGLDKAELDKSLPDEILSVSSDYFLLVGQINYGESRQGVSAIFYRTDNQPVKLIADKQPVKLIQRWLSVAETP